MFTDFEIALLYTALAGAAIPLGATLASVEKISPAWIEQEFRHSVIAFGGGALLAAVSFVLVPEGSEQLSSGSAVISLLAGGLCFFLLDRVINRRGSSASQLVAMISDFIPEAIALGAIFASGKSTGPLLALLIALQNLPEGFNAFREIAAGSGRRSTTLVVFSALALLGPIAAWLGYTFFVERPVALGMMMLFASGGILFLIFQDIAPQARLERSWAPPLGAVCGFALGLLGHMLIG